MKKDIKKARALSIFLGEDPTPNAVAQIRAISETGFTVNGRNFHVLNQSELLRLLEGELLAHLKIIPAHYLALFMQGVFKPGVEFATIVAMVEAMQQSNDSEAIYQLRKMIEWDMFIDEHIAEIIQEVGIQSLFRYKKIQSVSYNETTSYWIIEDMNADEIAYKNRYVDGYFKKKCEENE